MATVAGLLILHLILLLKLKFTAWPEMLLWPYLWLHNILPYKDVAIAHTPLLIAKLAIFYKLFGVGIFQLQIFTWILIIATDLILYFVAKKIWNSRIAQISLLAYVPLQIFFDGNGLWFDLVLVPIALTLFYLVQKKKYFWAGIIFALGVLSKQTFVYFLIPVLLSRINYKKFIFGGIIILLPFLMPNFYTWAIKFGVFILPRAQGQIQFPDLKNLIVALFPFLIFLPALLNRKSKFKFIAIWALFGLMGAYPRFEYFHFQPALPFLAISSALVFSQKGRSMFMNIFLTLFILGNLYLLSSFLLRNYNEGVRFYEQNVIDVANYVKDNTKQGDKIFVMNWWDNIYALTDTIPATDPWVPQLSWYQELSDIQEKEVSDISNVRPKLILLQDYSETGLSSYKPKKLYDYVMANYKIKEKVDGIEILIPR